ncbi:hypothetical protein CE91St41_19640 [Oscillospiraceae bacterium]|nr:hypothetical protein CE91St40_17880 [Oscillospiraceae bacterium]BDF75075.1 hypothetical protein CE91St41_19640 [Oscillospiraceae bacterium]
MHCCFDSNDHKEVWEQYHLVPKKFDYANINIVIGANGSGKTRLLKAIRDIKRSQGVTDVIYGYFPALSDRFEAGGVRDTEDLPDFTLFEFAYLGEASFDDFLRAIEAYNGDFFSELLQSLNHYGRAMRERGKKTLGMVKEEFHSLTGKNLMIEAEGTYVVSLDDRKETLSEALSKFSPGELMIFYISIFLTLTRYSNKKKVVILDEPELHLHPKILLSFIKRLAEEPELHGIEELWIATHSIFLVPQFDFENIIFMRDGAVQPRNSSLYENIYTHLLGEENEKIAQFLSSISEWQFCNFIAECFENPTVVDVPNADDEQVKLFIDYLDVHKTFRILDYGGGSARLGLSLKQALDPSKWALIDYEIFDPTPQYEGDLFKVYSEVAEIKEKYSCIVLMNVLHELPPETWPQTFDTIYNLLEDGGYLIFAEVFALTRGEMPNDNGYIMLGLEELKILLYDEQTILEIKNPAAKKSLCAAIPKRGVAHISPYSVLRAVQNLEERTFLTIQELRKEGRLDSKGMRHYAFLSQLYLNAKLYNIQHCNMPEEQAVGVPEKKPGCDDDALLAQLKKHSNLLHASLYRPKGSPEVTAALKELEAIEFAKFQNVYLGKDRFQKFWKIVLGLEAHREDKQKIAALLAVASMLGDKKSINRLKNQYLDSLKRLITL